MRIFVDIDHTICDTEGTDYEGSIPKKEKIKKVNEWYDAGHTIVYWTARGTMTGISWFGVTLDQLKRWGCKFHELRMGKPAYDAFIDDKNWNSECDWDIIIK